MKEAKFRVWNNHKKEMFYFDIPQIMSSEVADPILIAIKMGVVEPLQFTGLKDKGGKEIYEEDIIKTYLSLLDVVGYIKYSAKFGCFCLIVKNMHGLNICLASVHEWYFDNEGDGVIAEVIGNMDETPELLNGNIEGAMK